MEPDKTALIVDDEQSIVKNFTRLLKEEGFNVCVATNGTEALEQVRKFNFDLMLIDFRLPDIDGTDLVEKMGNKAKEATKLMITGYATLETRVKALELDIDAFVEKPVAPDDLLSLIRTKMSERRNTRLPKK
jgi:DNA-binding NtrC family response regulator